MGQIASNDSGGGGGKHKKVRAKKMSTHLDMTPMVDLAFLLLTFFMLTTTFSKPKTMEINMPVKPENEKDPQKINNAVTAILSDKHSVYWYYGEFNPELTQLTKTDFSPEGIRKVLLDKNASTKKRVGELEDKLAKREIADSTFKRMKIDIQSEKQSLFVLIKTDDKAKYKDVIDMLDECQIASVGKYAVVDIMQKEYELIQNYK
ncbi:MAG TPA: biopolymer transporter ExbD [Bacteroidia bacterium]|nr:biopolymer transporter ExbD [Bacteroidia bacterium]HNU33297.1 biopolymer transporter ExbD [Bacteroidia bacterium]